MSQSEHPIIDALARTTQEIFSLESLKELLNSGKQLRLKYGVDVTAPTLHIGHAVNLWMLRLFQDHGHKVIFLIGDFTTQIGDPTGKNKTRPVISQEAIEENTKKFIEQAQMVLRFDDPNLLEVRKNSEWFGSMPTQEFLQLMSMVTHARLLSRDMFQKRIANEADIYMHELIYPLLQGYDSVMLESDLTIIGNDQLFNEMLGRFYQEKFDQKPQVIMTSKITPGLDGGEKQSKSIGNYVGLAHSPRDKFGRVMTLPDELIIQYLEVYTDVSMGTIRELEGDIGTKPMECKKFLAQKIVERYHGAEIAEGERQWFENTFSKKQIPDDIVTIELKKGQDVFAAVVQYFDGKRSRSDVRRLFQQGGVSVDGEKIKELDTLAEEVVYKVGKKDWFKVVLI
jgi:tyrosyl-tRNA synthetase